ncbi:hypothetical protein AX15_006476 [Amanita polypyramis BW_CC]|nr:hypothetical protein AX15_006476 [Amanita polypyramis BW_CC]
MPQIARIDKIQEELTYPSPMPVNTDKNRSRPPPTNDSLTPYEDTFTVEAEGVRKDICTYYGPTIPFNFKLICFSSNEEYKDWQVVAKKKAQANICAGTKPNQLFIHPQVQQLLNQFKPGLRSTRHKLLIEIQDMVEHQDNWDLVMDKAKLIYVEWTASNALLLAMDMLLSQDQQALL